MYKLYKRVRLILFQALDGFLFVVNGQGKVEFVSDNICQYLHYAQVSPHIFVMPSLCPHYALIMPSLYPHYTVIMLR